MATTTRYSLTKPTVGADAGAWGGYLNANLDTIDATLWNLDNAAVKTDQLTLDGATSGSIVVAAAAVASGTLTLPAATDTLVGRATTDTLTNKTLDTAGAGNVLRINGTQVSTVTGTGSVVLATFPTLTTPNIGTPSAGTLTNCTGLPVSTGISGLGSNVATFLATPSSANLASAVTDETGTGALVFGTSPTIATPTITTSAVIPLVNGGTTASSTLTLQSTSGTGTSDAILFKTGSQQERMRITTSGAVGIGVTPSYTLEVRDAGSNSSIAISNSGATGELLSTITNATGVATISSLKQLSVSVENAEPLIFKTTGSERMRIDSSGNLLVGTTSALARLTVSAGTAAGAVANITSGQTGTTVRSNSVLRIQSEAAGRDVHMQFSDNVANATEIGMISGSTYFCTGAAERMRINSSGLVGIGKTSPTAAIDVLGPASTTAGRILGNANAAIVIDFNASGDNYYDASNHIFRSAGGSPERMRIDSVGNVKVGGTADRATTAGTNQVVIFNGTAPVGTLANGCSFYSTAGEMRVMDAAGNATLLSPHDSVTNEWIYDSSHTPSGKRLKINVERLLRFINDHFGLDCVHDLMEEA